MAERVPGKRVSLIGLASLLAALSTGCGGDQTLTKEQYGSKLSAACEDFVAKEKRIGEPQSFDDLVEKGPRIVAAFDKTILKQARDLKAPDEIADQAHRMAQLAQQQHDVLSGLAEAAKAGDFARVTELASKNNEVNEKASSVARELGAKACAGDRSG